MAKKIKIKTKKPQGLKAFDIALQYYQSGNLQQAEVVCRQILQKDPFHADAMHLIGVIAGQTEVYDVSISFISKAIHVNPSVYYYYNDIGVSLRSAGRLDEAIENFQKAVELRPDFAGAFNNLGIAFSDKGLIDEAIVNFKKALSLNPDYTEARNNLEYTLRTGAEKHYNLGGELSEKGLTDAAIENYQKALMLKPDYAEAYNNLAGVLYDKGLIDEAIGNYRKALSFKSDFDKAYNNLAVVLTDKGMVDEAIDNYRKALELNPYDPHTHANLGIAYLLSKDFVRGWDKHKWRLKTLKLPPLIKPVWNGSSLKDTTILIYAEQGYGDTLQFVRYLPKLYEDFGARRVLFIPLKGLEQLLRESDLKAEILDAETSVESLEYDTNIHLMSLPRIFKTNLDNIPFRQKRYLKANPEKVKWYKERFFNLSHLYSQDNHKGIAPTTPFKIGIFWQGNPELKPDRRRSMPLKHFFPVCRLPNVKVYSLQKGYGIEQLNNLPEGIEIVNLGETFNDFSDTAAAVENLDLVITVDTAIGHLSGALGKKTWILLPSHAEWRWHLDMDYSPWYEDVRLFRHKEPGKKDWDEMIERVKNALSEFLS